MARAYTKEENEFYKARLLRDYDRVIEQIEGTMANGVGNTFGLFLTASEGKLVAAAMRKAKASAEKIETNTTGE